MSFNQTIAILGGGGALGSGIARRLAQGGARVIIGSRDPLRAADTVALLNAVIGDGRIAAATYIDAARSADIIVVTVPFSAQRETLLMPRANSSSTARCRLSRRKPGWCNCRRKAQPRS
jgi:8-hydroxy-5-deazaflavin:NADPH oxidoreductase